MGSGAKPQLFVLLFKVNIYKMKKNIKKMEAEGRTIGGEAAALEFLFPFFKKGILFFKKEKMKIHRGRAGEGKLEQIQCITVQK